MAGETVITVIGNLTGDPDLRYTSSGTPVANLNVASTPRTFDREAGEWKDGTTLFLRGSLWRDAAENAVGSLRKGDRVIVQGALTQRSYEKDGLERTVVEIEIHEIGASLRYAQAEITRTAKSGKTGSGTRAAKASTPTTPVDDGEF
ncbi:single-stranded DNA-binding protein [Myceligenerans halotolerans]